MTQVTITSIATNSGSQVALNADANLLCRVTQAVDSVGHPAELTKRTAAGLTYSVNNNHAQAFKAGIAMMLRARGIEVRCS